MVSMLDSGLGGLASSPGRGTALCSWATLYSHSASLHPGVIKGLCEPPLNFLPSFAFDFHSLVI